MPRYLLSYFYLFDFSLIVPLDLDLPSGGNALEARSEPDDNMSIPFNSKILGNGMKYINNYHQAFY